MEKKVYINLYRQMLRVRYFEETLGKSFAEGAVPGFVHLCLGQEAVAAGVCENLNKSDYVTSTHRGHGHGIAKGCSVNAMMAELYGRKTGLCKGRGGSMHLADKENGFLGTNGIVGDGVPMAAGAALAAKIRTTNNVAVAFFGDGAITTGAFHEGANLAAVLNLPLVFICENNTFAVGSRFADNIVFDNAADLVNMFGMPTMIIDGNDVVAVYEATKDAVKRARNGEGPSFIECKTVRWRGHFEGDPQNYRSAEEKKTVRDSDPIRRFEERLIEENILSVEEVSTVKQEVEREIQEAVKYAENSPWPDPLEDVINIQY